MVYDLQLRLSPKVSVELPTKRNFRVKLLIMQFSTLLTQKDSKTAANVINLRINVAVEAESVRRNTHKSLEEDGGSLSFGVHN